MKDLTLNSCASPGADTLEEISNCPICMDTPEDRGVLDCGHSFCYDCIIKWSKQENSCPLCKKEFNFVDKVPKKAAPGKRQTKRKRVDVKNKHQGHSHGSGQVNGGPGAGGMILTHRDTLAGLFGAALYGDASMLRELLMDRHSQGVIRTARRETIANEMASFADMRRIRGENEMSRHSAERSYSHGHSLGHYAMASSYPTESNLPTDTYNHAPSVDPPRRESDMTGLNYSQRNKMRRLLSLPQVSYLRNPAGRSSNHAINLCDDDADFSVVSASFPASSSSSSSSILNGVVSEGIGSSYNALSSSSNNNSCTSSSSSSSSSSGVPSAASYRPPSNPDLSLDLGRYLYGTSSSCRDAIDLTCSDEVVDLIGDETVGLGDLWAVHGTSSSSSSSTSSSSSLPSSSTSSSSSLPTSSSSSSCTPSFSSSSFCIPSSPSTSSSSSSNRTAAPLSPFTLSRLYSNRTAATCTEKYPHCDDLSDTYNEASVASPKTSCASTVDSLTSGDESGDLPPPLDLDLLHLPS